jgi:hypothetical protein
LLLKVDTNISVPKLHPFIKLHKEKQPIRPLINFKTALSYSLAKYLDTFIKRKLITTTDNSIKNTYDFIEKINKVNIIPGCKMISLDVKNLYTSIPKFDALNILKDKLSQNSGLNTKEINEIIHSVNIIINQNYFEYDKKMYSQNDGFVMGSPLSAILSKLYLEKLRIN